jgi:hypothetical protein
MWFIAPVASFATAWGIAAAIVASNGGFGAGDLPEFAFWSLPPALLLHPLVARLDSVSARWHAGLVFLAGGAVAAVLALAWAQLVALALGPYIMAFSFPVVLCWLAGSTIGLAVGLVRHRPQAGQLSPLVLVVPAVLLFTLVIARPQRPPDLLIEPSSLASQQDVATLLGPLLNAPPTPDLSTYNPVGIRTVSRADTEAGPRIRVTFHATSDRELRREYIARIRASPLVASVTEVPVR